MFPRIWTDYEDQKDDLSAVYSSWDFIWWQNETACHRKDTIMSERINVNNVNRNNGLISIHHHIVASFIFNKLMVETTSAK